MISVAAYCRVSTDHDDQLNSFASQQRFFREYIERNPQWELFEIYADEGISGTSTKKRIGFNRMIEAAYQGNFQLILTKEVSRFSRNIVDTILYTRELKSIGVSVLFLTENIDTSDPKSEMLLSFMATLAQEESRKTGSRVTWGQQRQMEKGVVFGHSMLGYEVIDGVMRMDPDGAEIVRLIFQKYTIEKVSAGKLARFLENQGYRTSTGNPHWSESHILKILKNEKYVGDLVQRKSFTPDYLTHQKKTNHGEVPLITIQNHHEPIIERELWEHTQERLKKNNKHNGENSGHSNRYLFSGIIKCGACGASFVSRRKHRKSGDYVRYWCCAVAAKSGRDGCDIGIQLRDEDARTMLKAAIEQLQLDIGSLMQTVVSLAMKGMSAGEDYTGGKTEYLQYERMKIQQKKEKMMDAYFSGEISRKDMLVMKERYEKEYHHLQEKLEKTGERMDIFQQKQELSNTLEKILHGDIESEIFYKTILDHITVFPDRHIELMLRHLSCVYGFLIN